MLVGLLTGATLTHMIPLDTATHASNDAGVDGSNDS